MQVYFTLIEGRGVARNVVNHSDRSSEAKPNYILPTNAAVIARGSYLLPHEKSTVKNSLIP